MSAGVMPTDGPVRLGSVGLLAGRRISGRMMMSRHCGRRRSQCPVPVTSGRTWRVRAGLAPRQDQSLTDAALGRALDTVGPARIGLVPASRPADVLALIGHDTISRDGDPLPLAAVLRSWEDRFGATLLEVGYAHIRLLARRPPTTLPDAQAIAAELWAMCDEFWPAGTMSTALWSVTDIAEYILTTPIWLLWLD